MRKIFTLCFALFIVFQGYSQSETHNFITYDTTVAYQGMPSVKWMLRISRPANLFVANNPDTASRPALFSMPGTGEVGTDPSYLVKYGPHYFMANGLWDGSVVLGNGTHYPIIITICQGVQYTNPLYLEALMDYLIPTYHLKRGSIHVSGLSWGAFLFGDLICFSAFAGDQHSMSLIRSYVGLTGVGATYDGNNTGHNYPGYQPWQIWATQYGGHFLGLEGTADYRGVNLVRDAINSAAPGSAYFAYEKYGGGTHCCWNSMYDPTVHDWQCVAPVTNPNLSTNTLVPNSMGTYKEGSSLFQWMLRQGDTSMVGSTVATTPTPVANAGVNQNITLPTNSVALSGSGSETGGTIKGYAWKWVSGPSQYTFSNANVANPTVSNLVVGSYVFQLTVTDAKGVVAADNVSVVVNAAAGAPSGLSTYFPLPGSVQAEAYAAMSGVSVQATADAGGGSDVGSIDRGDWLSYNITVASAGAYVLSFRLASPQAGAAFQVVNATGAVLATVAVPVTGGYETWTTANANVTLPAGQQTVKLVSSAASHWNINWFSAAALSTGQQAIPGVVQAESFAAKNGGVVVQATADAGGGSDVGGIDQGDWMSYSVNVASAGAYQLSFRVATPQAGAAFQLVNGAGSVLATVAVPVTGGYETWTTVNSNVTLAAGAQTLKLVSSAASHWNINWFSGAAASTNPAGTSPVIPGVIQAESYTAKNGGLIVQATADAGGGSDVGGIDQGDWLSYNVNVISTGSYVLSFRVATPQAGAQFQLVNAAGAVVATVAVPVTGGYETWTTVNSNVTLADGTQTLKLISSAASHWNINWFSGAAASKTGTATDSSTANAEAASRFVEDSSAVQTAILLYPNPTKDAFQLAINNAYSGKLQVQVISPAGRVLKVYTFEKGLPTLQEQVSLAGLPAGIYLVRIGGANWQEIRKVIKQ